MKKLKIYWLFILLIQMIVIIIFAINKNNFFVDEIYSFGFANSYYMPIYLNCDYYDIMLNGEFWHNILTVQKTEIFDIKSVIYNIQTDVHPPLYYIILHMVSSFFPDILSKWMGIIPNIVFFIINQVLILAISKRIFKNIDFDKNKFFILLPCIFYGFSLGTINSILFIRMYMLLSLWSILLLYLNIRLFENINNKQGIKNILIAIFFTIILGILTQYIYIIYAGLIFIGYTILFIKNKYYNEWKKYLLINIFSIIITYLIYPKMLMQLMGNNMVTDITNQKSIIDNISAFKGFLIILSKEFFGGSVITGILCFILLIAVCFIIKNKKTLNINKHIILNIAVSLCFVIIMSKVAPYVMNRYLFIIYPLISIAFIMVLYYIFSQVLLKKKHIIVLFLILIISINISSYRFNNINYKDDDYIKIENMIDKNDEFIFINHLAMWYPDIMLLAEKTKNSYMLTEDSIIDFNNNKNFDDYKRKWIYISKNCKLADNEILYQLNKNNKYKNINKVYENWFGKIYLLE